MLSDARARLGAERLALALALTRTRTIRSPEQALDIERAEGVLDPAEVLPDWAEDERQAILRRALFDPATYGRVRFHHRSVQEYLAACRLKSLRDKGMSAKALFRFLFAERYGVAVVIPSMRAISAWLALWDEDVRAELMAREPEILLSNGDPETLSVSARVALLRAFAASYGEGGWRGIKIPIEEARRLAHPELATVIKELWGGGPSNEDVRELLLELIWQGAIEGCVEIAEQGAYDIRLSEYHRIISVRALLACNRVKSVRRVADSILQDPDIWSDRIVRGLASDLFRKILTVAELVALVERTREPKSRVGGFGWNLHEIAQSIDPWSEEGVELRKKLADLIWRGRHKEQKSYRINGHYDYIAPALALLCGRQLSGAGPNRHALDLIWACVVASRFGKDKTGAIESIGKLRIHFDEGVELRGTTFWVDLELMDQLITESDDWHRLYNTERDSVIGHLAAADRVWLEAALGDTTVPQRRGVALRALIQLWNQGGRIAAQAGTLREAVKDDSRLAEDAA